MSSFTKLALLSSTLLLLPHYVWAVGANCKQPTSELDKRICQSTTLTAANEALNVAFHNQRAWLCQDAEILRREDGWDCMAAKEDFWAEQRQWDKAVLAQCKTNDCFTQAYQARIAQINGQDTPLPNFRLTTYGWGDKECQAYLKVLNRTPREEFRGCKLPDLSGSEFTTLPFKPVTGELLKKLDEQIALRNHEKQVNWQAQLKKYQSGYLKLEIAEVDLDKDGKMEKVVKYSRPSFLCDLLDADMEASEKKVYWQELNDKEIVRKNERNGYLNLFFNLDSKGVLGAVEYWQENDLVLFKGKLLSFGRNRMVTNRNYENWGRKEYIEMDYFLFESGKGKKERWCGFWYNY